MSETDKIVAAVLAGAMVSATGDQTAEAYLDQYESFIRLLAERDRAAKEAKSAAAKPKKSRFEPGGS
jgi:hypothetical protein